MLVAVADVDDPSEPSGSRRGPGQLSAQVLAVLAESADALTPGEVRDRLGDQAPSYSAVVTTLTRLHDKDAVTRHRDGRAYRYAAKGDANTLVAWQMSRLLAAEADHAAVLSRFVDRLDASDEAILRRLLTEGH